MLLVFVNENWLLLKHWLAVFAVNPATDVTHNYTAPGVYTVRLIALSDKNCSNEITTVITVHPNPEADFNLNSAAAQCFKNNSFNFKNTTTITGGNLHYTWDMGNGDTFASSDVTYSYPLPGTYTVKLWFALAVVEVFPSPKLHLYCKPPE